MGSVQQKHILIIGAGFAGLRAAQVLSGKNVRVTLVDKNNFHLFQPLLYQVATTGLNPSEISSVIRSNFRKSKNVKVLKATLSGLNKETKIATFDDGEFTLNYDYLLLGIGGVTSYFGKDEWAKHAPGLKSLDDAVKIRNRLLQSFEEAEKTKDPEERKRLTSVVVIGGGPTGVEMAGSIAELRSKVLKNDFKSFDSSEVSVSLVEGGDALLGGYDPSSSTYTKKKLERMGVSVYLNERVTEVTKEGIKTPERSLQSRNIIWAAGVQGHPLTKMISQNTDRGGRLIVTPELLIEGEDSIYACGDLVYYGHDERFPKGLPGVAQVAMQQGERAAKNILAELSGKDGKAFNYFDKGKMATIGRSAAVAESKGLKLKGFTAWIGWLFIHLVYLVEFQDRVVVFMRWLYSYLTWNWGVRIILGREEEDRGDDQEHDGVLPKTEASDEIQVLDFDLRGLTESALPGGTPSPLGELITVGRPTSD